MVVGETDTTPWQVMNIVNRVSDTGMWNDSVMSVVTEFRKPHYATCIIGQGQGETDLETRIWDIVKR